MDLYTDTEPIKIDPPINYDDLNIICKCLNVLRDTGNTIELPMNDDWNKYMTDNSDDYTKDSDDNFHRQILWTVDIKNDDWLLTHFGTKKFLNSKTVLLKSDVIKIQDCISKIHNIHNLINKNDSTYEHLKDPVSLNLLNNPLIASDGFTYSRGTLFDIFRRGNPKSPITREELILLNGKMGIPNKLVSTLIDKFYEEKITIMNGGYNHKYNKYKTKYLKIKNG
jgi:hypothetical protein